MLGSKRYAVFVYILTNKNHTVLYTGVTRDLVRRVYEHKNHADPNSFTAKYKVHKLVYFEETSDVKAAIEREKQIKGWPRHRKVALIFEKTLSGSTFTTIFLVDRSYREIATAPWASQ